MRIKDILMIQGYVKQRRNRKVWHEIVRMMACVVVFCTVYALILPAITMEQSFTCGLEAHQHTDECRASAQNGTLLCSPENLGVHSHSSGCYDADGNLQCGISDKLLHIHDEHCYDQEQNLVCQLTEVQEHRHTTDCYSGEALVCGQQELYPHIHSDECWGEDGSLICGALETISHTHSENCPVLVTEEIQWICGMEEHIHSSACQAPEESQSGETTDPAESTDGSEPSEPEESTDGSEPSEPEESTDGSEPSEPEESTDGSEPSEPEESTEGTRLPDPTVFTEPVDPNSIATMATGDSATLNLNFYSYSQYNAINFPNGNAYTCRIGDTVTIRVTDQDSSATYYAPALTVSGCEVVSTSTTCSQNHAHVDNSWYNCGFSHEIVVKITGTSASITCQVSGDDWSGSGNSVTIASSGTTTPTDPPETEETETTEATTKPETVKPGYPTAVKTGKSSADTLLFYNFEATSSTVKPLAGCVFEIRSTDGSYVRQITSGNTLEVELPADIPEGNYTITEISTPYGYLRDDNHTRSFSIGTSSTLNGQKVFKNNTIGSFLNHSLEDTDAGKTAEVEDYNNRTYEIILNAAASIKLYEMEPVDVLFVVDQSNSMLFPSGLKSTGKSITLHQDPETNRNFWGGTTNENTTPMDNLNLDKDQVYYIIADPQGTSTVFALWHNGTSWMYQDASYYAKAYYENAEGYRQDDEMAAFPQSGQAFQGTWTENNVNYKANGGDLGYELGGSLGTYIGTDSSKSFEIYTAVDQYNRLHYLEESITQAVYQLSDANPENTVTVIRFAKEVDESHCMGPLEMTPENANEVVDAVNKIQTDGGTRQDLALEHAYNHLTGRVSTNDGGAGDHYTKDVDHTFTILITDGAPVRSGSDAPALDTIYADIETNGALVRQESTLITIGLGMGSAERGKQVLEDIASEPHSMYANMLDDASELSKLLHDLIFSRMTPGVHDAIPGEIVDVISDSFYPIAWLPKGQAGASGRRLLYSDDSRDWVILHPGDWITVDGGYVGTNRGSSGAGQLTQDSNGDMVIRWEDSLQEGKNWSGRFFVKAKEDFIGGNAIDTNKEAYVDVRSADDIPITRMELPVPTVNVRLLDMNQMNSEVTVFLGDLVNEPGDAPIDSLKYFYNNTHFTKLVSDPANNGGVDYGPILNAIDPDAAADGLEHVTFSLAYAMGKELTAEQWEHLMASGENTVRVDYTYDDASSHGPVGYFTFRLTKTGETADYQSHEATVAGEHVEEYTLHVTYTAYELGDNRPTQNVHNGSGSPGTEVADENGNGRLEEGYGIVDKDNVHIVHVIEGSIRVNKEITSELIHDADQTFYFNLHRAEDGDDHSGDRTLEVVIPAGQTTASAVAEHLPRGTWVLTEQASDAYSIKALTILETTNCYAVNEGTSAVFHIGDDTNDANVIGKVGDDRYTSYTGTPEGVFGEAMVLNEKTVFYGEIPVQKVWGGADPNWEGAAAYVVLYRTVDGVEQLVLDTEGHARILRLDAANGWQASFQVALPEKDADVKNLGYFVREVGGVTANATDNSQSAILENDGTTLLFYTQTAGEEGRLELGGNWYMVLYETDPETGTLIVSNHISVTLPETGGHGTKPYTTGGLLLIAAALVIGYNQRRRREGRAAR